MLSLRIRLNLWASTVFTLKSKLAATSFTDFAFRQELGDFALALGEGSQAGLPDGRSALLAKIIDQPGEQPRTQVVSAAMDFPDGGDQLLGRRFFENVAAGPDLDRLGQVILVIVHREKDDSGVGAFFPDLPGGFKA